MEGRSPTKAPTAVQRHKTAFFFHIFEVSVTGCVREIRKEGNENLERTRCADVSIRNMLTFASTLSAHLVAMFFLHLTPFPPPPPVLCVLLHHVLQMKSLCTGSLQLCGFSIQLCDCIFHPQQASLRLYPQSWTTCSQLYCWVSPAKIAVHWDCCNAFVFS